MCLLKPPLSLLLPLLIYNLLSSQLSHASSLWGPASHSPWVWPPPPSPTSSHSALGLSQQALLSTRPPQGCASGCYSPIPRVTQASAPVIPPEFEIILNDTAWKMSAILDIKLSKHNSRIYLVHTCLSYAWDSAIHTASTGMKICCVCHRH